MNIGKLRHRITLQTASQSQNDFGEWVTSYTNWATVWAAIEPNLGKRYMEAKQANSEVQGVIRIRYKSGVLPTMRVTYGTQVFEIVSIVHPQEQQKELHILYKEALD